MIRPLTNPAIDNPSARFAGTNATPFLGVVATIALAFFCTEHDLSISELDFYGTTATELEESASGDHFKNQFGFSLVAILGMCLLASRRGAQFSSVTVLGALILAALAWCIASRLWTISPWLTTKRVGILLFCFVGALGMARRFSLRQMCWLTLILTTFFAVLGLCVELSLGTFQPWSPSYRFAGTLHPNAQGDTCACICLAALPLLATARHRRLPLAVILCAAFALLLLTKSRTACLSLLAALALFFLLTTSWRFKLVAGLALGIAGCLLLLIANLYGVGEQIASAALLGREQDIATLTGRTELWNELLPYAEARPLLGYGYASFWTPEHIAEVSSTVYWGTQSAHSIYLESVLSTGVVGMALAVSIGLLALVKAGMRFRATRDPGYGFLFAILAYGLINGFTESGLAAPSLTPWIVGVGVVQLAFFEVTASNTEHAAS